MTDIVLEPNANPFITFKTWLDDAKKNGLPEYNAMALATASRSGQPSVRFVLFKELLNENIYFYTNYNSRKSDELIENPFASVAFFWPQLYRQIRIEGPVQKTSQAESESYFSTRPRTSQIGAWASNQSHPISSRDDLFQSFEKYKAKFAEKDIPCPPHWGGFKLTAQKVEFWLGAEGRLHERLLYSKASESAWASEWLAP